MQLDAVHTRAIVISVPSWYILPTYPDFLHKNIKRTESFQYIQHMCKFHLTWSIITIDSAPKEIACTVWNLLKIPHVWVIWKSFGAFAPIQPLCSFLNGPWIIIVLVVETWIAQIESFIAASALPFQANIWWQVSQLDDLVLAKIHMYRNQYEVDTNTPKITN